MTVFRYCRCISPVREGFYRSKLNRPEQAIYDAMFNAVMETRGKIRVNFPGNADLQKICDAFRADQPWFWYLDEITALPETNGYVKMTYRGSEQYISLQNKTLDDRVRKIIDKYRREVRRGDAYAAVEFVHDYLAEDCSYEKNGWKAHCIIGALLEHKAVCQGISYANKVILNAMKIGCISCFGEMKKFPGGHCWNMVLIGRNHYYEDITSDLMDSDGTISHKHALMNEENFRLSYTLNKKYKVGITGSEDNWFMRHGLHVTSTAKLKEMCRNHEFKVLECELGYIPDHPGSYVSEVVQAALGCISYRWSFDEKSGYLFLDLTAA